MQTINDLLSDKCLVCHIFRSCHCIDTAAGIVYEWFFIIWEKFHVNAFTFVSHLSKAWNIAHFTSFWHIYNKRIVDIFPFWLKSYNNKEDVEPCVCFCVHFECNSLNIFQSKKCFETKVVEKSETHILFGSWVISLWTDRQSTLNRRSTGMLWTCLKMKNILCAHYTFSIILKIF